MCVKICQKWISEVCFTLRHLEKNIFIKNEKISIFSISAQAGLGPASIFEKFRSRLLVKCKKLFFRNFETDFYKSGLTKFEIKFLKYGITKKKVIWFHIRFGFQISNFWKAGLRPAPGRPGAGLGSVLAESENSHISTNVSTYACRYYDHLMRRK